MPSDLEIWKATTAEVEYTLTSKCPEVFQWGNITVLLPSPATSILGTNTLIMQ